MNTGKAIVSSTLREVVGINLIGWHDFSAAFWLGMDNQQCLIIFNRQFIVDPVTILILKTTRMHRSKSLIESEGSKIHPENGKMLSSHHNIFNLRPCQPTTVSYKANQSFLSDTINTSTSEWRTTNSPIIHWNRERPKKPKPTTLFIPRGWRWRKTLLISQQNSECHAYRMPMSGFTPSMEFEIAFFNPVIKRGKI